MMHALDNGIMMATEDRKQYGLVLCRPISENISLPFLSTYANKGWLDRKKEREKIKNPGDKIRFLDYTTHCKSGINE